MKRVISLTPMILMFLLVTSVAAGYHNEIVSRQPTVNHNFLLDSVSWASITISCSTGDTLSGEFILSNNGDLFIGDQTKYDNWLLDGIDFLIVDTANYDLWSNGLPATPLYERKGVVELEWSVEIPSEGFWYIIYYNDSIFIKQVEGEIQHISQSGFISTLVLVSLLGIAALLTSIVILRKKK